MRMKFKILLAVFFLSVSFLYPQSKVLIPMDWSQTDHLKAYGIAFWALTKARRVSK